MFLSADYFTYEEALSKATDKNTTLVSIRDNLIDMIWLDQPPYPPTVLLTLDAEKYTGGSFKLLT